MSDNSPTPHGAFSSEPPRAKGDSAADAPSVTIAKPERPARWGSWRSLIVTVVAAAITAGIVACVISVAANLLLERVNGPGGRLQQQGKVELRGLGEREVFYPVPYAGPPNLELETPAWAGVQVKLKEQKADHFTIINTAGHHMTVPWRADGIRADK